MDRDPMDRFDAAFALECEARTKIESFDGPAPALRKLVAELAEQMAADPLYCRAHKLYDWAMAKAKPGSDYAAMRPDFAKMQGHWREVMIMAPRFFNALPPELDLPVEQIVPPAVTAVATGGTTAFDALLAELNRFATHWGLARLTAQSIPSNQQVLMAETPCLAPEAKVHLAPEAKVHVAKPVEENAQAINALLSRIRRTELVA